MGFSWDRLRAKASRSWSTTENRTPISRAEIAMDNCVLLISIPIGKSSIRIFSSERIDFPPATSPALNVSASWVTTLLAFSVDIVFLYVLIGLIRVPLQQLMTDSFIYLCFCVFY